MAEDTVRAGNGLTGPEPMACSTVLCVERRVAATQTEDVGREVFGAAEAHARRVMLLYGGDVDARTARQIGPNPGAHLS